MFPFILFVVCHPGEEAHRPDFFLFFASFEEKVHEPERARAIYKFALEHTPKHLSEELFRRYMIFEKQFGSPAAVEDVLLEKRRFQYEEELKIQPLNYDVWFDYIRLEENAAVVQATSAASSASLSSSVDTDLKLQSFIPSSSSSPFPDLRGVSLERVREIYERAVANVPPVQEKTAWLRYIYLWINYAVFEELMAQVCFSSTDFLCAIVFILVCCPL